MRISTLQRLHCDHQEVSLGSADLRFFSDLGSLEERVREQQGSTHPSHLEPLGDLKKNSLPGSCSPGQVS